ncbi:lipoyl protein ligase domain-containing protein [Anaeroarcus burkinensis]|uniref:lipoyl protein ligase domain-containing protein n=1 Tax=Anaeroarcus burkinensis TaxID=82376 RepID=UPI00040E9795|nr:DUF116 domain-containing protein [Anaeroarcus burkinensis]
MASAQEQDDEKAVRTLNSLRYCIVTTPQFWVGRHQEIRQELQEESCRKQGVTYGRRITGGDSMCLQQGDFFCEFHCERKGERLSRWIQDRLNLLGVALNLKWEEWNAAGVLCCKGKEVGRLGWVDDGGWTVQLLFYGSTPDAALWLQYLRLPREKRLGRERAVWQQRLGCLWPGLKPEKQERLLCDALEIAFCVKPVSALHKIAASPPFRFQDVPQELASLRQGREWMALGVNWEQERIRQICLRGNASWDSALQEERLERTLRNVSSEVVDKLSWGGISAVQVAGLVRACTAQRIWRRVLGGQWEAANFRWVGVDADWRAEHMLRALQLETPMLLLPYCAKPTRCFWRRRDGCGACGACGLGRLWELAKAWGWQVKTIQNYEQLEASVASLRESGASLFLGVCCPLFTEKHYLDFLRLNLPGLLLMLDHSACYDQGCDEEAHQGEYEAQAEVDDRLQAELLWTLRRLQAEGDKDNGKTYAL